MRHSECWGSKACGLKPSGRVFLAAASLGPSLHWMSLSQGFVQSKGEAEVVSRRPGHQEQSRSVSFQVPHSKLQEEQRQQLGSLACTEWEEEN